MKYLRRVKGVTRLDRIKNEIVREELKVVSVLDKIEEQQLKWFGHLCRVNEERPVKNIWEAKTIGKRTRGRPRKTWNDEIIKTQNVTEVTPVKVYEKVKVMEDCRECEQIHENKDFIESGISETLPSKENLNFDVVGNYHVEDQPNQNEVFAA
ncbi:hypothetical protein RN001_008644 [Aquatica leii]|uniref:Uncharacterized protein n=1 Tax=Aquatica leii TaxID=1421715 RepID=A0AAN7SPB4_9COLE|nr:hypothetical protein RN001_008644 [Aquatica leii]